MLFSSSTGRFGRTGQVDYAIANEVLEKLGPASIASPAALPRRLRQLGAVGRRHGHAATQENLRSGRRRPHSAGSGRNISLRNCVRSPGDAVEVVVCPPRTTPIGMVRPRRGASQSRVATPARERIRRQHHRASLPSSPSSAFWIGRRIRCWNRTSSMAGPCCRRC